MTIFCGSGLTVISLALTAILSIDDPAPLPEN
jgi:hypothetical protein